MPQLQSLTIEDGETTPVSHTFVPENIDNNGVARLKESDGTPIGDNVVTISLRKADSKYKGRMVLVMPEVVTETINGVSVPRVARTAFADLSLTFDQTSTVQERTNVLRLLADALGSGATLVDSTFINLEGIY